MGKPRPQPLAVLLNEFEGLSRGTFRRKQRLAQQCADGTLPLVAFLRTDTGLESCKAVPATAPRVRCRAPRPLCVWIFLHVH